MYYAAWSDLSKFHVSPEAQVEAAKQIVKVAPYLPHRSNLLDFASVDVGTVEACTAKIEAAVQGSAQLSLCEATPSDVASEIAANEVRKQSPPPVAEQRFFIEYRNLWGAKSSMQLHQKLTEDWIILGNQEWEFPTEKKETPLEKKPKELS
jgi:hypothetical protein